MPEFTFLVSSSHQHTPRERALRLSHARSHAAKVTHSRQYVENAHTNIPHTREQKKPISHQLSHAPLVLYKGNSDPFSTSLVDVTPRVTQVLTFLKEVYIPSIYPGENSWISSYTRGQFLSDQAELVLSSSSAYCDLLPYLTMLAVHAGGGELQREATSIQLQIIQNTRRTVADPEANQEALLQMVKSLFMSALAEQAMHTARSHGVILGQLLFSKLEAEGGPPLHDDLLINVLYFVLHLSQMTLRRSVIDVDFWDPHRHSSVQPVVNYLEPFHDRFEEAIDPCLSDKLLRLSFRDLSEGLWLWHMEEQPSPDISQLVLKQYCCLQHNAEAIGLVNHFVQFKDELMGVGRRTMSTRRQAHLVCHAVLALSLLALLATYVANPKIGNRYLWNKHTKMLSQIQVLLTRKLRDGLALDEGEYRHEYRNALLFALWAGATWEHKERQTGQNLVRSWFSDRFRRQCQCMELTSWQEVEPILNGFSPAMYAQPPGSAWVDAALEASWSSEDSVDEE